MSDYPTTSYPPPPVVNDFPSGSSVAPPPIPMVNDFSRGPPTENVVEHRPPPSYGFLNASALNNTNNVAQKPTQQPPQWGSVAYAGNTGNIYGAPSMLNPEINNIENYTVWSVLNIIFCCFCLGLVACYYSTETDNLKLRGDIQGALNASRNARTMNIVSTILGIIIITINVLYLAGVM